MLTEGMCIADRYVILEKIGTGGMSDVYKAMDNLLGRNVAVKVLKSEYSEDVNFLAKFRTEAQAAAGLEHPNIVNIYDVGSENKMHYIVMEYVEGITLKTYIEKKEKLSYKEAISIAIQTANGIRVAHNKQIVHRDIKPQNIIISTEGKVKVTDFGIARAASSNTINSETMGSVHYASPEQARNGFIDAKSDIYSLGVVMYEMVTGRVPFHGDTAVSVALQHLQEEIIFPSVFTPDVPISLEKIILKCTQKSPDRRYASVDDLIVDLKKALINPDEDFVVMDMITAQGAPEDEEETEVDEEVLTRDGEEVNEDDLFDEDEDEGALLNPKMEKAVTIMGIVAAVFMVVVIVLIAGTVLQWWTFGGKKEPSGQEQVAEGKVEMIDITKMTFDEAREALNEIGLGIEISDTETSDTVEAGCIISQSVKKGKQVDTHTTIKVVVSLGEKPEEFDMPDVIGMKESQAIAKLQGDPYNLVVAVDYEYSDTVAAERVIEATRDPGEKVTAGSRVTIIVSRGVETIEVPPLANMSETQAKNALEELGLKCAVEQEESDTVATGYVIRQSKEAGKSVEKGTTITIYVSKGKATKYYSFSKTIEDQNELPERVLKSVRIQLFADGNTQPIYETTVTSLPKTINVTDIANATSGKLKVVCTYDETDADGNVTSVDVPEEYAVTFTAQ